ncbi:hypothetical protein D3C75_985910 [compost metagenome]
MVDFAQADFGDPRKERCGGNGQWHHRRPDPIGGTDNQAGKGDQRDHQDQKRDRAEQVDERPEHPVQGRRLVNPALAAGDQDHRQRNPGQQGDQRRHPDHQQGIEYALEQAISPHNPVPLPAWPIAGHVR